MLDGHTYKEIGQAFGISKQAVQQALFPTVNFPHKSWVYPNIRAWAKRRQMTAKKIAEATGVSVFTINKALSGKVNMSKSTIDALLNLTGMTYEECFYQPKE